jgi:holo-[acyl-carrier protein] synthase
LWELKEPSGRWSNWSRPSSRSLVAGCLSQVACCRSLIAFNLLFCLLVYCILLFWHSMIFGVGIDLVNIPRMATVLERWGERFVKRVFTKQEAESCYQRAYPASSFALRFAAKEAFSKALGLGMRQGIRWRDIEVYHLPGGRPTLKLRGKSSELCREKGIVRLHLSLSDESSYGAAVVILEDSDETGQSL